MSRTVFVSVLLAIAQAGRVQVHQTSAIQTQAKWGASCDSLQNQFHDRVTSIHASLEGVDETSELGGGARTRLSMRMYGIIRTLRRAKDCSWVIENDSADLEQMRGVVQHLLAGNQCAEAARSEMERGNSEENVESIPRAMNILLSDDCEAPEVPEGANTDATPEELLQNAEDELEDGFDELNDGGSAFIEMDKSQTLRGFMRGVGVFFLMLFLVLACTAAAAVIAFFLVGLTLNIFIMMFGRAAVVGRDGWAGVGRMLIGGVVGGVIGLPACSLQLYNNLLPRLTQ